MLYNRDVPGKLEWINVRTWLERKSENGSVVVFGDPLYDQVFQRYTLQSILLTYGQPSEVLVLANEDARSMDLLIYYPQSGISALFNTPLQSSDEMFSGCMSKANTDMYLWSPELGYSWSESVSRTTGGGEAEWLKAPFLPISEATSMTIEKFYTVFKVGENTSCIETPVEIWPGY